MRKFVVNQDKSLTPLVTAYPVGRDHVQAHQVFDLSGSFWVKPCDQAPLDPNSGTIIANLAGAMSAGDSISFNTWQYTPPVWIAGPEDPLVTFTYDNPTGGNQLELLSRVLKDVRIPAGATPAKGTDKEVIIYQPDTDTYVDMWNCTRVSDTEWKVGWGGKIVGVSRSQGVHESPYGAAASGLAFLPGLVTPDEVLEGHIAHVVGIALPTTVMSTEFSAPATRTDGTATGTGVIRQGQRLRLKASFDVERSGLSTLGKLIARASQTYGLIVWDQGSPSIRGLSRDGMSRDPWPALLGGDTDPLKGFPIGECEVVQKDWTP